MDTATGPPFPWDLLNQTVQERDDARADARRLLGVLEQTITLLREATRERTVTVTGPAVNIPPFWIADPQNPRPQVWDIQVT